MFPFKRPALHFRCRSIIIPITKSYKELGLDVNEISDLTRASMDGSLAKETTFTHWFDGKGADFQKKFLGEGRYELFKMGKITLNDLMTRSGKVLTLGELRAKFK